MLKSWKTKADGQFAPNGLLGRGAKKKKKKKMWIVERKCMSVQDVILQADEDLDRRRYIAMGF